MEVGKASNIVGIHQKRLVVTIVEVRHAAIKINMIDYSMWLKLIGLERTVQWRTNQRKTLQRNKT